MSEKRELTRAELVRLRREKENAKRTQRAAKEATRPLPAITTRAEREPAKPKRRTPHASSTRRRFQIALLPVAPGAEMRSIHIPRPRLGPRLLSFIFVALLGAGLYCAFNLPDFRVVEAQVTGNQVLSAGEINSALNIAGQPIVTVVPADLETRLRLNYPEIVFAKVTVALPNVVSVVVLERRPVVRWEQGGGYTWVAEDGVAFRPRGEDPGLISVVALSAPPTEGNVSPDPLTPAPFISAEMVQALKKLGGHVPPGVPILYDASFGFGWNDPRGWRVYFGTRAADVELKMRVYDSMMASLTQRGIRPAVVNVTYPTAPYYRMSE